MKQLYSEHPIIRFPGTKAKYSKAALHQYFICRNPGSGDRHAGRTGTMHSGYPALKIRIKAKEFES